MGLMHFSYLSKTLGYHTNIYIILPIDNFNSGNKSYKEAYQEVKPFKTLYLLHGGGGNAQDWIRFTSIERYAQEHNIAIVMPEVGGMSFYTDMLHGYNYFTYLTEELPEIMQSIFPLSDKREDRYVAGLSMGGYGAFKWAFRKPEFFAAAAGLSGISLIAELFKETGFESTDPKDENSILYLNWGGLDKLEGSPDDTKYLIEWAAKEKLNLPALYVCIGTEDFSYEYTKRYIEYARENGIDITYEEGPGKHDWKFWDTYIQRVLDWLPVK